MWTSPLINGRPFPHPPVLQPSVSVWSVHSVFVWHPSVHSDTPVSCVLMCGSSTSVNILCVCVPSPPLPYHQSPDSTAQFKLYLSQVTVQWKVGIHGYCRTVCFVGAADMTLIYLFSNQINFFIWLGQLYLLSTRYWFILLIVSL